MPGTDILIIDDEPQMRQMLTRLLTSEGYKTESAEAAKKGLKFLEAHEVFLVLCDVKLPDGRGTEITLQLKKMYPETEIILFTAYGNISDGVLAIKNGAFDYLVKGDDNTKIIPLVGKAVEKAKLQFKIKHLQEKFSDGYTFESLIGHSKELKAVKEAAVKVAPTDTTVLLTGETGTGKEILAHAMHHKSLRKNHTFVALNCSAFPKDLLESELFGYKAGAFTGAQKDKKGLIEEAHQGTLFLDEIGEMPPELQAKFLRVLESGEYLKIGDTKTHRTDIRIIAATHRNLQKECAEGRFRTDLFYRLSAFQIDLPSLRERKSDIPLLADHFIHYFALKLNKRMTGMEENFKEKLLRHAWPGNVRELRNVIERACILENTEKLTAGHLPFELRFADHTDQSLLKGNLALSEAEKKHIYKVLAFTEGNKTKAAELLGIGLTTLYTKLREYETPS